jgi:hypothetical protein
MKTSIKRWNKGQYPPNIKQTERERERERKTILNIPTDASAYMK